MSSIFYQYHEWSFGFCFVICEIIFLLNFFIKSFRIIAIPDLINLNVIKMWHISLVTSTDAMNSELKRSVNPLTKIKTRASQPIVYPCSRLSRVFLQNNKNLYISKKLRIFWKYVQFFINNLQVNPSRRTILKIKLSWPQK